jgi:5-formyltetrahydrofolate cyclo-ligase
MVSDFEAKQKLRDAARAHRLEAHLATAADAASALARHFTTALKTGFAARDGAAIAGYWPIGDEVDVRPLLEALTGAGYAVALPRVAGAGRPLAFHRWRGDDALIEGAHGISEPDPAVAPELVPDIVITPLLAFDPLGYRLGYGAGYYDRTLRALRAAGQVLAVGAAFAAQQVDHVPHGDHDEPLDWVVTEAGAMEMAN